MKIELCAASQEAIQIASELKLDRIELCQNLDQGGLTPSAGMITYAKDLGLETHVLIRPRAGGFHYSDEEMKVILNDVQVCKDFGVQGIVIGFLQPNFEIDLESIERINSVRGNLKLTFHRAFDDSIEWRRSLDKLIACGVDRLLTSGFASNVDIGLQNLIEMTSYSNGRMEIMPGGGVNVGNMLKIKRDLDPESIHFSGTIKVLMDEESAFSETLFKADANRIAKMCDLIRG
jgi:copper homeostasis protein